MKYDSAVTPRRPTVVRTPRSTVNKGRVRRTTYQSFVASDAIDEEEEAEEAQTKAKPKKKKGGKGGSDRDRDKNALSKDERKGEEPRGRLVNRVARKSERGSFRSGRGSFVEEKKDPDDASETRSNSSRVSRRSVKSAKSDRSKVSAAVKEDEPRQASGAKFPRTVVALYDYEADEEGELSFKKGEKITVTEEEEGWYTGFGAGGEGVLPGNYVKG